MWFFKNYGLLGQNARNLKYISPRNEKFAREIADSKLKTKFFLSAQGVEVAETIAIIKNHDQNTLEYIESLTPPFVIKPNRGFGGKGIIIIDKKLANKSFVSNYGEVYTPEKLKDHISAVLDGFYSLSGSRDKVIIEQKIVLHAGIDLLGKYGLPDIRVITYNMVPVMAMMRIPTAESKGKANLHAGACGAGIDIGSGRLTHTTYKGKIISGVPGIGNIKGIQIPDWEKILTIAVQTQNITGINYLGCDLVIDINKGPLLLEINLRPGLAVQLANLSPLKRRLDRVDGIRPQTVARGVRIGRDIFGYELEQKAKNITGKKTLGTSEYIKLTLPGEKTVMLLAQIDGLSADNKISLKYAQDVLKLPIQKDGQLKLKANISGVSKKITFVATEDLPKNIVLGRSALKGFIIDPFKYKKGENPVVPQDYSTVKKNSQIVENYKNQLLKLDKEIMDIDKKLLILKYVNPNNTAEQREKFLESKGEHIPVFTYNYPDFDLNAMRQKLEKIKVPDIPLGQMYQRKKDDTLNKIDLLRALMNKEDENIELFSKKIYGEVTQSNLEAAENKLLTKDLIIPLDNTLGVTEITQFINRFNHIYNIKLRVKTRKGASRFAVKGNILLVDEDIKISKRELRAVVAHEIEGHYLRKINGRKQPLTMFARGSARYTEAEEGIAIYNQSRFVLDTDKKSFGMYRNYVVVDKATKFSGKELIKYLSEYYNGDLRKVFKYYLRVKRGFHNTNIKGAFMKDVVYLNGYTNISDYIDKGGSLRDLYLGKITPEDAKDIENSSLHSLFEDDIVIPFFF